MQFLRQSKNIWDRIFLSVDLYIICTYVFVYIIQYIMYNCDKNDLWFPGMNWNKFKSFVILFPCLPLFFLSVSTSYDPLFDTRLSGVQGSLCKWCQESGVNPGGQDRGQQAQEPRRGIRHWLSSCRVQYIFRNIYYLH